jgi:hypothetical protein
VAATGDVDLRLGAPPEKHPRLNVFQPDMNSSASAEEDVKSKLTEFQSSCLVTGFLCLVGVVSWDICSVLYQQFIAFLFHFYHFITISSRSSWFCVSRCFTGLNLAR